VVTFYTEVTLGQCNKACIARCGPRVWPCTRECLKHLGPQATSLLHPFLILPHGAGVLPRHPLSPVHIPT